MILCAGDRKISEDLFSKIGVKRFANKPIMKADFTKRI